MSKSIQLIKQHEGLRLKAYKDTVGVLTIGYGYNLEKGISNAVADLMLEESMEEVYAATKAFTWFKYLSPVRQAVIENMLFNLGWGRFRGFKKFISYMESGDYLLAAEEMLDSKWAGQVGRRAVDLSEMMRTDRWPK